METEQKINLPNTYRNFTPQTSEENVSQDKYNLGNLCTQESRELTFHLKGTFNF